MRLEAAHFPMRNPFSSKLYTFLASMLNFSALACSYYSIVSRLLFPPMVHVATYSLVEMLVVARIVCELAVFIHCSKIDTLDPVLVSLTESIHPMHTNFVFDCLFNKISKNLRCWGHAAVRKGINSTN